MLIQRQHVYTLNLTLPVVLGPSDSAPAIYVNRSFSGDRIIASIVAFSSQTQSKPRTMAAGTRAHYPSPVLPRRLTRRQCRAPVPEIHTHWARSSPSNTSPIPGIPRISIRGAFIQPSLLYQTAKASDVTLELDFSTRGVPTNAWANSTILACRDRGSTILTWAPKRKR